MLKISPTILHEIFQTKKILFVYRYVTHKGHRKFSIKTITCSYFGTKVVNPHAFIANINKTSGKVEKITFMERNVPIDEFFWEIDPAFNLDASKKEVVLN